jgi:toxin ParE1/3/4
MKPIVPRERADRDIDEAIAYYAKEAPHVVDDLIDALEAAYNSISDAPRTGSPRYATSLDIPGLRFKLSQRFPYAIFYIEHTHYIDVIRVLHQQRDIPTLLLGEPDQ